MSEVHAAAPVAAVLRVNGTELPWQSGLTLAELVQSRGDDGDGVATAVNGAFVPRRARVAFELAAGDAVLVFGAIVGG